MEMEDRYKASEECKTPGAIYHTTVNDRALKISVNYGIVIPWTEDQAIEIQEQAHNALEKILAPYFSGE